MALPRRPRRQSCGFLNPDLSPPERTVAQVEGWILGVRSLIRTGKERDDSSTWNSCAGMCLAYTKRHEKGYETLTPPIPRGSNR